MDSNLSQAGQSSPTPAAPYAVQAVERVLQALGTTLAASGAYTNLAILDVQSARKLALLLSYTSHAASGTGGQFSVIVEVSCADAQPAATDESWYPLAVWDGSVTSGALTASSLPAGTDYSTTTPASRAVHRKADIRNEPAAGNSAIDKIAVCLDVTGYRWAQVKVAECGVVANQGTLGVRAALSV